MTIQIEKYKDEPILWFHLFSGPVLILNTHPGFEEFLVQIGPYGMRDRVNARALFTILGGHFCIETSVWIKWEVLNIA